ncbi:uncharacterized protein L201_004976 [Kwoniella dendrophila CBS 6074]|uniref:Uncharacterized protein n=1 Tax=Kwoniella dendrophila CBS 6074 TaxID=1295534 RepID=A0AAX4JZS8_9TREE
MVDITRPETGLNIPTHPEQYNHKRKRFDFQNNEITNNKINHTQPSIYPSHNNNNKSNNNEELEEEEYLSPKTHPFARINNFTRSGNSNNHRDSRTKTKMGNSDPTNEFMYQIPLQGFNNKSLSEGGFGLNSERGSQPLDLRALNERLQTLGLGGPSLDSLGTSLPRQPPLTTAQQAGAYDSNSVNQSPQPQNPQLGSGFQSNHFLSPNSQYQQFQQHIQAYPSVTEIAPNDSISMYRPARAPSTIASRGQRRGGTNVDPGDNAEAPYTPEEAYEHNQGNRDGGDGASYWSQDDITARTPRTGAGDFVDEMTVGPTSVWTKGDMGRDMYDHRDRLLRQESNRNQEHIEEIQRQIKEAKNLASTATKLEAAEKQLRELQARLIAEQVARTQIEQESSIKEEEMQNYQNEWASAVRALRRARDEGKKSDEEKRRIQRCFEEARDKLWKYHEALRVREARAQGKEEGRAEAWQEAERWMGSSPPIPGVDPVQAVPGAVLHQTPMMQNHTPMTLQSPTNQYFHQQQGQQSQLQQPQPQQPQQQWQPPQAVSPDPNAPNQSIAQLMEYFAQNPQAFPGVQQNQQQITPPQQMPQPQASQSVPQQQGMPIPQHTPGQQVQNLMPQQTGYQPQNVGAAAQYLQQPGQSMMPQHTGQQQMAPMMPQQQGAPPQHSAPQPMMVPMMVPMPQTTPMAVPQTMPANISQLPPNPTQQSHPTVPAYTQPTIPPQPPTVSHKTPRAPTAAVHTTPGKGRTPNSARTQATRLPPANRTGVSTVPHVPHPESVVQPHTAESYLERVDHDPTVKKMMGGAKSKTIHSSAVPPSEYSRGPTQPNTAARSTFDDGASNYDKPLPNPFPPSQVLGRNQTHRTPSTVRQDHNHHQSNNQQKMSRRMSLSEGLHNSHAIRTSQIPGGDRYPAFPLGGNHQQGKTHSRNTSYGSVDPAGIGLPSSRDVSNVQSPNSEYRGGRASARQTPSKNGKSSARSRVAGALRNDMDLESELPDIEEAEEEEMRRLSQGHVPPHMMQGQMPPNAIPPPHTMRQMPSQNGRGPPRGPPSMPNMRHRINTVMPQPLGGGPPPVGGPNKTFSEPHATRVEKGHKGHHSLSTLFHHRDPAAGRTEYLPEPESTYHPPKTHDIFVPPGLAPAAVSGGVEDVQGPRTSALGLSGLGPGQGPDMDQMRMKAPTSSHSRSNNPVSAYFPPTPTTPNQTTDARSETKTEIHHTKGRQPINLDSPPAPGTTRQTVIITERTNNPEAHQVPLPKSKSNAPTAYSGFSPEQQHGHAYEQDPRDVSLPPTKTQNPTEYTHRDMDVEPRQIPLPRSMAPTAYSTAPKQKEAFQFPLPPSKSTAPTAYTKINSNGNQHYQEPHQVPLPPTRSIAPTAYTASPPEPVDVPEVKSLDFANFPLPRGGGTVYDLRTQVTSEPDIDEPRGPSRSQSHKTPSSSKKSYRKPIPNGNGNGNAMDPRNYPLPPSRAPTRVGRASTYAASVPPIEEVTEPESGRENTLKRQTKVY